MRTSPPPKEGGFAVVRAVHLLSDDRLAFESLRNFDRARLFEPRQVASQSMFVWENLGARTYLHRSARFGNEGLVASNANLPGLTGCV